MFEKNAKNLQVFFLRDRIFALEIKKFWTNLALFMKLRHLKLCKCIESEQKVYR